MQRISMMSGKSPMSYIKIKIKSRSDLTDGLPSLMRYCIANIDSSFVKQIFKAV